MSLDLIRNIARSSYNLNLITDVLRTPILYKRLLVVCVLRVKHAKKGVIYL